MVSIGIQSLLWINCDKFKLNSNIYSKNINYNYDKMKRYSYKFVIKYIESGLKFPLILNKKVSIKYDIVGTIRDIMETIDWFAIEKSDCDSNSSTHIHKEQRVAVFDKCMISLQTSLQASLTRIDVKQNICNALSNFGNDQSIAIVNRRQLTYIQWTNSIRKRNKGCDVCNSSKLNRKLFKCKICKNRYYCSKQV